MVLLSSLLQAVRNCEEENIHRGGSVHPEINVNLHRREDLSASQINCRALTQIVQGKLTEGDKGE